MTASTTRLSANTRIAPVRRSMVSRTLSPTPMVRLEADSRADSRASKRTSLRSPSRARSARRRRGAPGSSSDLPAQAERLRAHPDAPCSAIPGGPGDSLSHRPASGRRRRPRTALRSDRARRPPARGSTRGRAAERPPELAVLLQLPVQARRGHLEVVAVRQDIQHVELVAELPAQALEVREVTPPGLSTEPHHASPAAAQDLEVDQRAPCARTTGGIPPRSYPSPRGPATRAARFLPSSLRDVKRKKWAGPTFRQQHSIPQQPGARNPPILGSHGRPGSPTAPRRRGATARRPAPGPGRGPSRSLAAGATRVSRRSRRGPDLDPARLAEQGADRDTDRDPEEVGVLELDAGALVPVVEERVEAGLPRSPYSGSAVVLTASSLTFTGRTCTWQGAMAHGQTMPSASWRCSMADAAMRAGPMP